VDTSIPCISITALLLVLFSLFQKEKTSRKEKTKGKGRLGTTPPSPATLISRLASSQASLNFSFARRLGGRVSRVRYFGGRVGA